jgi:hypothetical protein
MYTDSIYAANVYTACNVSGTYNVSNPAYSSTKYTEVINSVFKGILDESVYAAGAQQTAYPENNETPAMSNYCPPPSIYSAIATTEETTPVDPVDTALVSALTGPSYLNKYYPISEDEVVHEIRRIRHVINNADLSGMNDIQKYNWIENRFKDTFGNDFMMARNLSMPSSMFYMISVEFNDTLNRHMDNPEQVNRQRLFGNASTAEIQNKISAKYSGEPTNRSIMLMANEMRNAGVLDSASIRSGSQGMIDTLRIMQKFVRFTHMLNNKDQNPFNLEDRDRSWTQMLDHSFDSEYMHSLFNLLKVRGNSFGNDVVPFLINYTDGVLDEEGYFEVPRGAYPCYEKAIQMLFASSGEYDDLIRSRMALIDSEEYTPEGISALGAMSVMGTTDASATGEGAGIDEGFGIESAAEAEEASEQHGSGSEAGAEGEHGSGAEEYAGAA